MAQLTGRQTRAIAALLSEGSTSAASRASGVPRRSLTRWLREPAFREALAQAKAEAMQTVTARLSGLYLRALDVISADLQTGRNRLQAAGLVLRLGPKLQEVGDLELRVQALEALSEAKGDRA